MKFDLTQAAKKALQNVVNNTLYRGKPIIEWANFIANNADDLISRQAAIKLIEDNSYLIKHNLNDVEKGMTLTGIKQALEFLPSVQPEQKTGRWIHDEEHQGDIHCSLCDEIIVVDDESWANAYFRFCPYCGARMEE